VHGKPCELWIDVSCALLVTETLYVVAPAAGKDPVRRGVPEGLQQLGTYRHWPEDACNIVLSTQPLELQEHAVSKAASRIHDPRTMTEYTYAARDSAPRHLGDLGKKSCRRRPSTASG
jgi:hypothetical protein